MQHSYKRRQSVVGGTPSIVDRVSIFCQILYFY